MKNQILLYQLKQLMDNLPDFAAYEPDSAVHAKWMGSAYAVVYQWMPFPAISIASAIEFMPIKAERNKNIERILNVMSHAISELEFAVAHSPLPANQALSSQDSEKALSTLILIAHDSLLITDKSLDPVILQRCLSQIEGKVHARLLLNDAPDKLASAVEILKSHSALSIETRTYSGNLDNLVFIDDLSCWQLSEPEDQAGEAHGSTLAPLSLALMQKQRDHIEALWAQAAPHA